MTMMRPVTRESFIPHNVPKEGRLRMPYADILGLITTAIGNLVDPLSVFLLLPWRRPDGSFASRAEVTAAFHAIKADCCGDYRNPLVCPWVPTRGRKCSAHGGWRVAERVAENLVRLTEEDVGRLAAAKLQEMWLRLCAWVPGLGTWNVNGQLATLNMAWAMGPAPLFGGEYPRWTAHARARNFLGMAAECGIRERGNPGVAPRNASNRVLFTNAHQVDLLELDPDVLWYPKPLSEQAPPPPVVHHGDALTDEELRGFALATWGSRRAMMGDVVRGIGPDTPPDDAA